MTQHQLRDRSWWSGPEIYVVVDDYDLVAGATGNPLTPLLDFLPHAKDLGLHVVVARRSGGAARAMFDPVLARLARPRVASGLMMSAEPDEGVLLGSVRPTSLPPGRGTLITRGNPDQLFRWPGAIRRDRRRRRGRAREPSAGPEMLRRNWFRPRSSASTTTSR